MKYYYVNLRDSTERREHMETMLTNLNLEYERFDAVNINEHADMTYTTETIGPVRLRPSRADRMKGAFGCFLSHYSIIEQNRDNPEPFVILEDDIDSSRFDRQWLDEFNTKIDHLISLDPETVIVRPVTNGKHRAVCISDPAHWIYTNVGFEYPEELMRERVLNGQYVKLPIILSKQQKKCILGLATPYCYIHNARELYNALVNILDVNPETGVPRNFRAIDRLYTGFVEHSYCINSMILWRRDVESDIEKISKTTS